MCCLCKINAGEIVQVKPRLSGSGVVQFQLVLQLVPRPLRRESDVWLRGELEKGTLTFYPAPSIFLCVRRTVRKDLVSCIRAHRYDADFLIFPHCRLNESC